MSRTSRLVVFVLFCLGIICFFSLGYSSPNAAENLDSSGIYPGKTSPPIDVTALPTGTRPQVATAYGRLPLYFMENRGQVDKRVKYYVKGGGQTTFFTQDEVVLALCRPGENLPLSPCSKGGEAGFVDLKGGATTANPEEAASVGARKPEKGGRRSALDSTRDGRQSSLFLPRKPQTGNEKPAVVRIKPVGLKKGVKIAALEQTGHRVNYFIGNDRKKWRTDIPTYRAVVYKNAYAGIDLKFYGQGRQLEYDVVVKPGADPNQVRFAYQGVKKLEMTPAGDLALVLPDGGRLLQKKPVVYQEVAGQRVPVGGKFRLCKRGAQVSCGFAVAEYDKRRALVIDPVLVYSTYLGGSDGENGLSIAVDGQGCAYITGWTSSYYDFPLVNPYKETFFWNEAFVTKFSPNGRDLIYSTYLGGTESFNANVSIAVDASGCAYVTGRTSAADFPTVNPYQGQLKGGDDTFVTKLSASGNSLIYSTYLGGSLDDTGQGIAVDASGCAYVTGNTTSNNFPTVNPYQGQLKGAVDAFVTKFTAAGNALVYSTYLGGSSALYEPDFEGIGESGYSIAVDANGCAYVTGSTTSTDFPTVNPYQGQLKGAVDAFVTKLSASGNSLIYSTYLGGSDTDDYYLPFGDYGLGIAVDVSGCAYVAGDTWSDDFPTVNPYQGELKGNRDAFVTKLSATGNPLIYSTYLGGSSWDRGNGIALDARGCAYVIGSTGSTDFPTVDPYQGSLKGGGDAFVSKLKPAGNALFYSTYLGGSDEPYEYEKGEGIAVDASGCTYVTGSTVSADFPTVNPYQGQIIWNFSSAYDAFVTKLSAAPLVSPISPEALLLLLD